MSELTTLEKAKKIIDCEHRLFGECVDPDDAYDVAQAFIAVLDKPASADGELGEALELAIEKIKTCKIERMSNLCGDESCGNFKCDLVLLARNLLPLHAEHEKLKVELAALKAQTGWTSVEDVKKLPKEHGFYPIRFIGSDDPTDTIHGPYYDIAFYDLEAGEFSRPPQMTDVEKITHYLNIDIDSLPLPEPPETADD